MILCAPTSAHSTLAAEMAYIESAMDDRRIQVKSSEKPSQKKVSYKLDRKVLGIEGGRLLIHLREPILVELDPQNWTGHVVGWNLVVPAGDIQLLPKILARKFLTLFSKADRNELSQHESAEWVEILDRVDYRRFSIDRAPARYLEGELLDRHSNFLRVKWHDGVVQKIERPLASALAALATGDEFGCYVKIGLNDEVKSIERLSILSAV